VTAIAEKAASRRARWAALVLVCGLTGAISGPAFAHEGRGHLAAGLGHSRALQTLRLEASDIPLGEGRLGTAWFTQRGMTVEIRLRCLKVDWGGATYVPFFFPASAHGHTVFASGRGSNGRPYHLFLWVPSSDRGAPGGFNVRTRRARRMPCGAPPHDAGLRWGAFTINP
jgi:hypothetical protein